MCYNRYALQKGDKSVMNELEDKVVKLQLLNCIENSKLYIDSLNIKIDFYNKQICFLKFHKPLWFQRKKIKEYNILLNSYEKKIFRYYNEINDELNMILKLYNEINDKDS